MSQQLASQSIDRSQLFLQSDTSAFTRITNNVSQPTLLSVPQIQQSGLIGSVGGFVGLGVLLGVGAIALRPSYLIPDTNEAIIVRGIRGTKVVHDRGILLLGARSITKVSLNKVEVTVNMSADAKEPVRTKDQFKANIPVTVDVRVPKNDLSILTAAETLGRNGRVDEKAIREAADAQLRDAIRGAAKEMVLTELDRNKKEFERLVKSAIEVDLQGYGLVVLSISIKEITEHNKYDANDSLDAMALEGRTQITEQAKRAEERLKKETEAINRQVQLDTQRKVLSLELEEQKATALSKIETDRVTAEANAQVAILKAQEQANAREKEAQAAARIAKAEQDTLKAQTEVAIAEERLKTATAQEQAEREKKIAILNAERDAQVQTAALVAEAEAKSKAALATAQTDIEVAKAQAQAQVASAEAKMTAMLKEAQGVRAIVEAQNQALPTAIFAQFIDKHGEEVLERLPEILKSLAPAPGILGDKPTIIGGQGDIGGMLVSASAAGLLQMLIGEGKLEAIVNKLASSSSPKESEDKNGSGLINLLSSGNSDRT